MLKSLHLTSPFPEEFPELFWKLRRGVLTLKEDYCQFDNIQLYTDGNYVVNYNDDTGENDGVFSTLQEAVESVQQDFLLARMLFVRQEIENAEQRLKELRETETKISRHLKTEAFPVPQTYEEYF